MKNIRHTALAAAVATSFLMGGAMAKELPVRSRMIAHVLDE